MKIACLGWGSLIWDSRELAISKEGWNKDGPKLPIEFTRISSDGRVTLIIDKEAELKEVLWAEMEQKNLEEACCILARREGTKLEKISHLTSDQKIDDKEAIRSEVRKWLGQKKLDAAIWTGLSYKNNKRPTIEEIISHLKDLQTCDRGRAEEYIRKAPKQIDTSYREKIELEFGWIPI